MNVDKMIRFNSLDKEILFILKTTYFQKQIRPMSSDSHMRIFLVRIFTLLFIMCLALKSASFFKWIETVGLENLISQPVTLFFGVLFLHINIEASESSVIIYILTCVSIFVSI